MKIDKKQWKWTREPKAFSIENDRIEIILHIPRNLRNRSNGTERCSALI